MPGTLSISRIFARRYACLWVVLLCNCQSGKVPSEKPYAPNLPESFDSLPVFPAENFPTISKIALGRELFFETRLSGDGKVSCGSCHKPQFAYADTFAVSSGAHGLVGGRNAPSLLNVAYQKRLFMEGGIPSLELQTLAPFTNDKEMNFRNMIAVIERLSNENKYRRLAEKVYGKPLDLEIISMALSSFQRSLYSTGSAYDAFINGDTTALSASARNGMTLFYSERTACSSCHTGFLFTDQKYYNIGLDSVISDDGLGRLSRKTEDLGKFKTPSLRNVAITYPYMHDGSLSSLDEVLAHFNEGGHPIANKDARIRPLELSGKELKDLKEFLRSLTDKELIQ